MSGEKASKKDSPKTASRKSNGVHTTRHEGPAIAEEPEYGLGDDEEAVDEDEQMSMEAESEDAQDSELEQNLTERREEGPQPPDEDVPPSD